jgi:cytochrome b
LTRKLLNVSSNLESRFRVWDTPVRLMHWSLVTTVVAAWFTRHRMDDVHIWLGYVSAAIVTCRILWGFTGSKYARFAQFVRMPGITWQYARDMATGHAPRYLGHNPLGGWMIVILLATLAGLGFTGWLGTTDMFWGYAWLANLHKILGWTLCACVSVHVSGVIFMSWRKRENLMAAMISGYKNEPRAGDID